jgi:hypothetical protein
LFCVVYLCCGVYLASLFFGFGIFEGEAGEELSLFLLHLYNIRYGFLRELALMQNKILGAQKVKVHVTYTTLIFNDGRRHHYKLKQTKATLHKYNDGL